MGAETDPGQVLPRILDAAIELTDAERGFLVVVGPAAGAEGMRVAEARGFDAAALAAPDVRVSRTVIRRVLERGRGVTTTGALDADVLAVSSVRETGARAILAAPLRLGGEVLGALYLDHRRLHEAFSEEDLALLEVFAGQAALAMDWAARDELTGERSLRRYGPLVGGSPPMLALYDEVERAARSPDPVLILGETGTGKELVARELHRRGPAAARAFHALPCDLPPAAVQAHVFGPPGEPERGLLEQAATLLLDDVDALPGPLQTQVAWLLKQRAWTPPALAPRPLRCRVLASSRADLRQLAGQGSFREDLFYRLDVLRIVVPPLRQRREDVPLLVEEFLGRHAQRAVEVSSKALEVLGAYAWPGNVRELENEVRRLCALGRRRISAQQLSPEVRAGGGVSAPGAELAGLTLSELKEKLVRQALAECDGNKARAARQLGVPRSTLYHLLERLGIDPA
ncbi:MAG: sigma 54-interacting transcriptional regulator [Planctomycetota bacterium]